MYFYNLGTLFLRIFSLETTQCQIIMAEFLELCSQDANFQSKLSKSQKELTLIPNNFIMAPYKSIKNFLIFLENITINEEIRLFLRTNDEVLLKLSLLLLTGDGKLREILGIIEKFLIFTKPDDNFLKKAFLMLNLPLISLLNSQISSEIKLLILRILGKMITEISFDHFELNLLVNLLEIYPKQEISSEIFGFIIKLLIKNIQSSSVLMKYPEVLKVVCNSELQYEISCFLILKFLYTEAKNIQTINSLAGKSLFLRAVIDFNNEFIYSLIFRFYI